LKKSAGLSLLVVDKSISELRAISDKVVILERGKSVWSGGLDTMGTDIKEQYLGV